MTPGDTAAAHEHFARGVRLQGEGRHADAAVAFQAALAADPSFAAAHVNLGFLLERAEQLDAAENCYLRAAELDPQLYEAHFNLGAVRTKRGDFNGALVAATRAVALRPNHAESLLGLANVHRLRNELAPAEAACRAALAVQPALAAGWINLANIRRAANRIPEALAASESALALAPQSPQAHLNAAMALLVSGQLRAGWPHAEYRHALKLGGAGREFPFPLWTGHTSLSGKSILLHGEQGYGDTLQFLRYAPLVAALGATVWVEVPPALKTLVAATLAGCGRVIALGEPLPEVDFRCPLPTLPLAFATDLASIPAQVPYVVTPPSHQLRWRGFLGGDARPRVGLAWCGNPTHPNDGNRSLSLKQLQPLWANFPAVQFFALKKEMPAADAAVLAAAPELCDLQRHLGDFADTAALIEQLDLVIAVDTSTAHLAGAMARPLWVLLPFSPDWRWLLEREDSPWYPTARLLRQPAVGDWASVVRRARHELEQWVSGWRR